MCKFGCSVCSNIVSFLLSEELDMRPDGPFSMDIETPPPEPFDYQTPMNNKDRPRSKISFRDHLVDNYDKF